MMEMPGLMNSSMLLLGFSLENHIKAVLVAHDPKVVDEGRLKVKDWPGAGHDLIGLIGKPPCNEVILAEDERGLLVRLGESVLWAGQYPIPKTSAVYIRSLEGEKARVLSTDFEVADDLIHRLDDVLFGMVGVKPMPRR